MFKLITDLLLALFNSFIFTFGVQHLNSQNKKITWKDFVIFTILFFVVTLFINDLAIVYKIIIVSLTLPILIHFFYKFNFFQSVLTTFIVYFLTIIAEILSSILLINILGYSVDDVRNSQLLVLYIYLIMLFAILFTICLKRTFFRFAEVKKKMKLPILSSKVVLVIYFIFTLLLAIINSMMYSALISLGKNVVIIYNVLFFAFYLTISLLMFYQFNSLRKQAYELEMKQKEYDQLKVYTGIIEDLLEELRDYKHDFANIILTLNGFLEMNNIDELKSYFKNGIIKNYQGVYEKDKSSYATLQKIIDPGLKGLLATKISYAYQLKLNVNLNILSFSQNMNIEPFDLYKIIGILLDNAIEASSESKEKELTLFIMSEVEETSIIIGNSFKFQPSIKEMFKRGYSTKGKKRGIGLNIVKNILDNKYTNIILNTFIQENSLIQELVIPQKNNGI